MKIYVTFGNRLYGLGKAVYEKHKNPFKTIILHITDFEYSPLNNNKKIDFAHLCQKQNITFYCNPKKKPEIFCDQCSEPATTEHNEVPYCSLCYKQIIKFV